MNNDLISKSELIEKIKDFIPWFGQPEKVACANEIIELVTNQPTVETDIEVAAKDAYEQGYTDGWKERFGEPNEIPQD